MIRDFFAARLCIPGTEAGQASSPAWFGLCDHRGTTLKHRRSELCLPRRPGSFRASNLECLALAIGLLSAGYADAAPPPDADPALAPWFQGLQAPDTGRSCCSVADCRPTESRTRGDHYEVLIEDKWLVVPSQKILTRSDNPTGRAIVCWTPAHGIMCFVHGPEG